MKLTPQLKRRIDAMSYESMLSEWRFSPVGSMIFSGECGDYFASVMATKRQDESDGGVAASKNVGWE